jgi:hypothetical protein
MPDTDFHDGVDAQSNVLADMLEANGLLVARASTTGAHSYSGAKIALKEQAANVYHYNVSTYLTLGGIGDYLGKTAQGFTVFGDTAFIFYDTGYCQTIDLVSKTLIASFQLPAGVAGPDNHAGQANFGSEYSDPADDFPVLYLSSYIERKCYVLRMTTSSATLVQTIQVTADGTTIAPAGGFFIDNENDKLVAKMAATDANGIAYNHFQVFDMPTLDLGSSVLLLEERRCDHFCVRVLKGNVSTSRNHLNAGFAMNGKLYVCAGFQGATSSLLVIDYEKHKILTEVRWASSLITSKEQEQCAVYGDLLLLNLNHGDYLPAVQFL